ncbi:hypothetical protein J3F83DRAFT_753400 [Trichoderma novae-zelandiae]
MRTGCWAVSSHVQLPAECGPSTSRQARRSIARQLLWASWFRTFLTKHPCVTSSANWEPSRLVMSAISFILCDEYKPEWYQVPHQAVCRIRVALTRRLSNSISGPTRRALSSDSTPSSREEHFTHATAVILADLCVGHTVEVLRASLQVPTRRCFRTLVEAMWSRADLRETGGIDILAEPWLYVCIGKTGQAMAETSYELHRSSRFPGGCNARTQHRPSPALAVRHCFW